LLQSGLTYRGARLFYKTCGTLNNGRSNVILYPISYGAQHYDLEWAIGEDKALDPARYFIITPSMFGNGLSSSPSNTPPPFDRARYQHFTMTDNLRVQQRLLQEVFGIEGVKLVYGFSMGAQQAFHWGALFPIGSSASRRSAARQDLAAQFRLPLRSKGAIDRRSGMAGRLARRLDCSTKSSIITWENRKRCQRCWLQSTQGPPIKIASVTADLSGTGRSSVRFPAILSLCAPFLADG
jgi:pimeloyl-ACP methyl ester carboxylesterase